MRIAMAALVVHDLHDPPMDAHAEHRMRALQSTVGTGGDPYEIRSTLMYTAVLGLPRAYAPPLRVR
jgi:hypothetical protein